MNDLQFFQSLIRYKDENTTLANAAIHKIGLHLWYLTEELVGLSFFDDRVPLDIKRRMVLAINTASQSQEPLRRLHVNTNSKTELELWKNKSLDEFVTKKMKKLFERFKLKSDFLEQDPNTWKDNESYLIAKRHLSFLRVVNDTAERGVALMKCYNQSVAKNEDQKQYVLKCVKKHREQYPNVRKSTLQL